MKKPPYTPDTMDELLLTIRELLTTAKRARERRSELIEYIVCVGSEEDSHKEGSPEGL
ncbi:MAG: hypothetical protein ACRD2L_15595 [Terriglobia bacterium]